METVVAPNINVFGRGVLLRFVTKLGSRLGGVLVIRNLSRNLTLPIAITKVVGIPQTVFTNSITTTHVNMIANQPLMNLMVVRRYRSVNVTHPKRGYGEPFIVTALIIDHKIDHYVKYLDFKNDVDLDVHVRMFNFVIKRNVETFEKYIINAFSYMLRDMTSDWCHNYMSKFPNFIFSELTQAFCKCHQKIQNNNQIYMELKNMKHEGIKRVEVYYGWIQKLVHGLQIPTIDNFLTIVFRANLQSYLRITTARMKRSTFQQHKEAVMLCEEGMTIVETRSALSIP